MTNKITIKDLINVMPDFNEEYDIIRIVKLEPTSTDRELLYQGNVAEIYEDEALLKFEVVSITIDYDDYHNGFLRVYVLSPENYN